MCLQKQFFFFGTYYPLLLKVHLLGIKYCNRSGQTSQFLLYFTHLKKSCSLLVSKNFFLLTNSEQEFFSCSLNGCNEAISKQENPCSLMTSLQTLGTISQHLLSQGIQNYTSELVAYAPSGCLGLLIQGAVVVLQTVLCMLHVIRNAFHLISHCCYFSQN